MKSIFCGDNMKYIKNIADRVTAAQKKAGSFQAKTDGVMYKRVKFIYYLFTIYAFCFSFIYVMFRLNEGESFFDGYALMDSAQLTYFYVSISALAMWIAAYVLSVLKFDVTAFALTLLPGIAVLICMYKDMRSTADFSYGLNANYWPYHFIPIVCACLFIGWAAFIHVRERLKFRRDYINMINRIYEQFHTDDIKEQEWESFLENYDPRNEEEKRKRNKKAEK